MFPFLKKIRSRVIFSWLVSYLSILLIPIIFSAVVYIQSVNIVQKQLTGINDAMIQQLQQAVDGQIFNMETISTQIAMNSKLTSLINTNWPESGAINFTYAEQIKQLFKDFNIYTLSNSFIEEFYIYIHRNDIVLTSNGYYTSRDFYDSETRSRHESYDSWQARMLQQYYNQYVVTPSLRDGGNVTTISLMRSLPLQSEKFSATLVVSINRNELLKLVESVNWANQDMFFIVNKHNQPLFSTKDIVLPEFVAYDNMHSNSGILYGELEGKGVVATYIKSATGEWNYISFTQTSLFNQRVAYIRMLTLISLILCVLIGGVIAFWFAKKNYNPLSQLIENISVNAGFRPQQSQNEYRFLSEAFSNAISEKRLSEKRLEQQMFAMRSSFIARLLKGRSGRVVPADEALKMYGMSFDRPYYAVILFYIDDYSQLMVHASDEENLRLAEFIIHNVTEEMMSSGYHRGFVAEVDDLIACLMNLQGTDMLELYGDMEDGIRKVQDLLERKFQIRLTAALSQVHMTVDGIFEAYQESVEAIEYKFLKGSGSIIRYDEIKQTKTSAGSYSYSLETERILTNSIKSGDSEQAEQIMDNIFAANFADNQISLQVAKCLMFDLVGTMIKTLNELSSVYEPAFVEELNPVERLLKCNTLGELRIQISSITDNVCRFISDNNKGSNQAKLRDTMSEFIEAHYHDGNLNLTMVADHVGLSAKYVSAFFKQATGEGISSYINKVRLSKAKELLSEPELSVSQVARRVGYTNSNALIRAFNKHEGVTPGQFRELSQTEKQREFPESGMDEQEEEAEHNCKRPHA